MLCHSHLAADKMGKIRAACLLVRAVNGFNAHRSLTAAVHFVFTPVALQRQAISAPLQQVYNLPNVAVLLVVVSTLLFFTLSRFWYVGVIGSVHS